MDMKSANQVKEKSSIPKVSPGDMVKVSFRIKEANRERLQTLPGLVVRVKKGVGGGSFTIRRVTYAVGVEHTFPFASPLLEKVELIRHGKVRRARLYYIRRLSAKEARLKERREKLAEELAIKEGVVPEGLVGGPEAGLPDEAVTSSPGETEAGLADEAKAGLPDEAVTSSPSEAEAGLAGEAKAGLPDEATEGDSVAEQVESGEAKEGG